MTPEEIQIYCRRVRDAVANEHGTKFIERHFQAADNQLSVEEFPYCDLVAERKATLKTLLEKQHVVILGEPGSGKSTLLWEAARRLAELASEKQLPVPLHLRSYRGSLDALANAQDLPAASDLNVGRFYLLDGLDEIPAQYHQQFAKEIANRLSEPMTRWMVTVRQAFFTEHKELLPPRFLPMLVLGFREADVLRYAAGIDLDSSRFWHAIEDAELTDATANPFVVRVLANLYQNGRKLNPKKSDNLCLLIDHLLATRPNLPSIPAQVMHNAVGQTGLRFLFQIPLKHFAVNVPDLEFSEIADKVILDKCRD